MNSDMCNLSGYVNIFGSHLWFFPLVNGGMGSAAPLVASSSSTKKPQSAKTQSPWISLSRKPDFKVISLSEALRPQPAERKLTTPAGVVPIKYLLAL